MATQQPYMTARIGRRLTLASVLLTLISTGIYVDRPTLAIVHTHNWVHDDVFLHEQQHLAQLSYCTERQELAALLW